MFSAHMSHQSTDVASDGVWLWYLCPQKQQVCGMRLMTEGNLIQGRFAAMLQDRPTGAAPRSSWLCLILYGSLLVESWH